VVELQAPAGVVPQHFRLVRLVPFPAGGRGGTMKRDGGAAVPGQSREGKCPRGAPDQVLAPHQVLAPQCRAVGREQGRRGRWRAGPGGGGGQDGLGSPRPCVSLSLSTSFSIPSLPRFFLHFLLAFIECRLGVRHCSRLREDCKEQDPSIHKLMWCRISQSPHY
jgi:hypothetical protein